MKNPDKPEYDKEWLWVFTHQQDGQDQLMLLADSEKDSSFVPAFATKENGLVNKSRLPSMPATKLELVAMATDEVIQLGLDQGFRVLLIDADGLVDTNLTPDN